MKIHRSLAAFIIAFLGTLSILAQDVTVTVTPTQQVLPPQVLLYITDPGKFFTITLMNTSNEVKNVHLGLQLEQTTPATGLAISTPTNRQPKVPFTIQSNSVYTLTTVEMKKLFDHIPASEISCPEDLFGNYENGTFGLLPEGFYQVHITAYQWNENPLSTPVVESNPAGGVASFQVCYNAQAPQFLTPMLIGTADPEVGELDPLAAQFTWTEPLLACAPGFVNFKYSLRVVELLPNQQPDYAMDNNPTVYMVEDLPAPTCMIPVTAITQNFYAGKTYLAQVTATASTPSNSAMNYVLIENEGKSTFRKFCIKVNKNEDPEPEPEPKPEPEPEPDDDDDNKGKGGGGGDDKGGHKIYWGGISVSDSILTDSLYTFRNPVITSPTFEELAARKILAGHDLAISWDRALHIGGEGLQPDTLKFEYKLKLYNGGTTADKEAALASDPVYEKRFASTELMTDTIAWDSLKTFITPGDYLVLHIEPHCINSDEVGYSSDKNIVDFAIVEQLSKKYFECSSQVEITNKEPLKASADELKDKVIAIGEYQMTIDEISADGEDGWKGKGRVEWNPMGTTVMVCVEFSGLKINTDYAVYEGKATTYSNNEMSDAEVVDKLFSDWGIDNLISDTGLPYADYLQSSATDGVKDIAKKLDLSKYYQYVKSGQAISSLLGVGDIDALYFPVALPDSINKSPVDLQIAGMTFSAEFATMNIIGEFTLPNSDYLKNDILVFGAPRLCISPDNIIPEGGTVALLSHFTIVDPKSDFEFTFKAPTNVISPENGCYLAWKDYTFEQLGLDIEMKIPGLKKEVNGELTDSMPSIYAQTRISEWENWLIDRVSMDPFQAEELPGWTFTASDIVYDHSVRMNSNFMGKFPEGYDTEQSLTLGEITSWQGLYIKEVSVTMPEALEFGDSTGSKRLKISAEDMFFDKSGATLRIGADNVLSAKTGKAGGWAFSLNSVSLEFIQNNFNHCKFDGAFDVPLIEGEIGYECQILHLGKEYKDKKEQYAYVFRTQQVDSLNFDFMLARADMDKNLTYFLVEAAPNEKDILETRVELLMGGTLTIGGTDYLQKKIDNMGMDFSIPGIHFAKMRIANCERWTSKFDFVKEMQCGEDKADILFSFYKNKDHEVAKNFWFSTGDWSLSSLPDKGDDSDDEAYMPSFDEDTYFAHGPSEYGPRAPADDDDKKNVASQKLGPFTFTLKDYSFDFKDSQLGVGLEGEVRFLEEIEFGASAGITIKAELLGVTEAMNMDFSKLNFKYKDTEFDKAAFDASFAGMTIKGSLIVSNDETNGKGYGGSLKFTMPGELFTVDALGGYFERTDFTWGYFQIELGSSTGLRFDPVVINNIKGGFYFNCIRKSETEPEPQKGIIGVVAGIGLSTSVGEDALKGDMEMTVIYDRENDRLSTFVFTGTITAIGGLVNSKASIVYENDSIQEYFALNITIDAKLDPMQSDMAKALKTEMDGITSKLQELNSECEGLVADVKGSLTDLAGNSEEKASEGKREGSEVDVAAKTEEAQDKAESEYGMNVGSVEISLDLKITMKQEGKELDKVKWHLYIGQPDENLRCQFTLIDFKSPIVSVNIGASAYLCLGNELPNDGELPPIPEKIQEFLNGSVQGEGVKSDDMNKANRGRTKALENFKADTRGGLMIGASAWGYVDVDLGFFYGEMGAIAGFDISLRKLTGMACINLPGSEPGYHGWYGEGQLYAYLYAVFGLKLDLGFWEGKFEVLNSGIGGVLRMGGINPNYFTGAARVKLRAFNGLVDINRKFEFECGDVCDMFYGNALDDFELFGNCSIGDTIKDNGWNEENKINPELSNKIIVETLAPLNEHFRVLDPTELARIERDIDADKAQLEALASRTFTFKMSIPYAQIYEYDSPEDKSPIVYQVSYDEQKSFRTNHILSLNALQANKFYRLEVVGCAKELYEGVEDHPMKYNISKNDYERVPWDQTVNYYFCTGDFEKLGDRPDLQKQVAFAFPSDYGQLKGLEGYIDTAYVDDIKNPVIGLKRNLEGNSFNDGELVWQLCNENGDTIETRKNVFKSEQSKYFYMQPASAFTKVEKNKNYKLKLVYTVIKTETVTDLSDKQGLMESKKNSTTKTVVSQQKPTKEEILDAVKAAEKAQNRTKTKTTSTGSKRNGLITPSIEDADNAADEQMPDAAVAGGDEPMFEDDSEAFITKLDYLDSEDEEPSYVGRMSMAPMEQIIRRKTTTKAVATSSTTTATATTATSDTTTNATTPIRKTATTTTASSTSKTAAIQLTDTKLSLPSGTISSNVTNEASGILKTAAMDSVKMQQNEADLIQQALKAGIAQMEETRLQENLEKRLESVAAGKGAITSNDGATTSNSGTTTTNTGKESSLQTLGTREKISISETTLLDLNLRSVEGNWKTGYTKDSKQYNVAYEIPYLGMRMRSIKFKHEHALTSNSTLDGYYDKDIAKTDGTRTSAGGLYRLCDPYWYLSYLSNYAFVGGYRLSATKGDMNIQATTTQSVLITAIGGMYEGKCDNGNGWGILRGVDKIRRITYFIPEENYYPLPIMDYELHTYREGGDARCPTFYPSKKSTENIKDYLKEFFEFGRLTEFLASEQYVRMGTYLRDIGAGDADSISNWYAARVGTYLTVSGGFVKFEIPMYHGPIIWGSQFDNNWGYSGNKYTMWDMLDGWTDNATRPTEDMSEDIMKSLWGGKKYGKGRESLNFKDDIIPEAVFETYRVNAYNVQTKEFEVLRGIGRETIYKFKVTDVISDDPKVKSVN